MGVCIPSRASRSVRRNRCGGGIHGGRVLAASLNRRRRRPSRSGCLWRPGGTGSRWVGGPRSRNATALRHEIGSRPLAAVAPGATLPRSRAPDRGRSSRESRGGSRTGRAPSPQAWIGQQRRQSHLGGPVELRRCPEGAGHHRDQAPTPRRATCARTARSIGSRRNGNSGWKMPPSTTTSGLSRLIRLPTPTPSQWPISATAATADASPAATLSTTALTAATPLIPRTPAARSRAASPASVSQQPEAPQVHRRPSGFTSMCPASPA